MKIKKRKLLAIVMAAGGDVVLSGNIEFDGNESVDVQNVVADGFEWLYDQTDRREQYRIVYDKKRRFIDGKWHKRNRWDWQYLPI